MARTRPPFATRPAFESTDGVARELRLEVITLSHQSKTPLPGTSLTCVELLIALYWSVLRIDPNHPDASNRDRFIFNKTNGISVLYAVLARRGFFPSEELKQFNKEGCRLALHPSPHSVPGFEWSIGQPGQGLGVGMGMALAAQLQKQSSKIYVLMDESEFRDGLLQETIKIASRLRLGNLTVIIETASSSIPDSDHTSAEPWQSLGWDTQEADAHDTAAIVKSLQQQRTSERPRVLIAKTKKGYSLNSVENDLWANRPPSAEEVEAARKELAP